MAKTALIFGNKMNNCFIIKSFLNNFYKLSAHILTLLINYYMKKLLLTAFLLIAGGWFFSKANAQCAENEETKILLVGDSWAFFMGVDQTINKVMKNWGHSGYKFYTNITIAENGAETDDFLLASKQDEIRNQLLQKPEIKVVHLSIGGNDFLGSWNKTFTGAQVDALADEVFGRLDSVITFIKSCRPDVHLVWSGYCYPNFGEVIGSMPVLQTSHPFYGRWEAMGFPTFTEINTVLNTFSDRFEQTYSSDPRITFIPAMGLMQYDFGQTTPLAIAPGGTYAVHTVPLPYGKVNYPSPQNTMRNYGITRDCFHLSAAGYESLISYQAQKFYQKYLMDDVYAIGEEIKSGSVSSSGTVSSDLMAGNLNGEDFAAIVSFNTVMDNRELDKVSLFLEIEEVIGSNVLDGAIQLEVKEGNFGTLPEVDPGDFNSQSDQAGEPCIFGSKTEGKWVRFDLPASMYSSIRNGSVQFRVKIAAASNAAIRFKNTQDNDFQPVLNIKYGEEAPLSVNTLEKEVSVYPVPAETVLNVQAEAGIGELFITDLSGRRMPAERIAEKQIDVSRLPSGIYLLNYSVNSEFFAKKIMKL